MVYEQFLDVANDDWRILVVELGSDEEGPTVAEQCAALVKCMSSIVDGDHDIPSD
jgi:hypothetical protein